MRKGFTYIEFLTVIVIVSVISLIVFPSIINKINTINKKSTIISSENYIRFIEIIIMKESENGNNRIEGTYNISKFVSKGINPKEGWIKIKNNKVNDCSFKMDNYIVNCIGDSNSPLIGEKIRGRQDTDKDA